ncbi:hypothetical protein L596_010644 [Steinernema carpocapsae]|uniref:RRM domain-containing protein n=1 Tax=Steinernema carpocapsae TaxID=34508 RepID=A0A4V6A6X4_STECR|nr:hypothetical protein L596_010644 [Steinernema carpocapsae]
MSFKPTGRYSGNDETYDEDWPERSWNNYRQPLISTVPSVPSESPIQALISKDASYESVYNPRLERRYSCYVSGLNWWTTDVDLELLIRSLGVDDLINIDIYYHRHNGLSKEFAAVSCGSATSLTTIALHLPDTTLGEEPLDVYPFSRRNFQLLNGQADRLASNPNRSPEKPVFLGTVNLATSLNNNITPTKPPLQAIPPGVYVGTFGSQSRNQSATSSRPP